MEYVPNLPLPDKAGRGALERKVQLLVRDLVKAKHDSHEFNRLSHQLDKARADFHKLYGVKEHPTEAPLRHG
jgi:hypothetical protein